MPAPLTVGAAAAETGWSARMLRYLELHGLVVPTRTPSGYRTYGLGELNRLRALRALRERYSVDLAEIAFAARLRREPDLRSRRGRLAGGGGGRRILDRMGTAKARTAARSLTIVLRPQERMPEWRRPNDTT